MIRYLWLRPLAHFWFSRSYQKAFSNRPADRSGRGVRPCLEVLEDRITPSAQVTVTDLNDDGSANSLRGAITTANNDTTDTGTYTIQLVKGAYTLSIPNTSNNHDVSNAQGDLNISVSSNIKELDIVGTKDASGKPTTTITVDQTKMLDRVFEIGKPGGPSGITVVFKDFIIENGLAQDDGGAGTVAGQSVARGGGILDYGGNVTLSNVVVQSNQAVGGSGTGTPHYAEGGGIYALNGTLTINDSVLQTNSANGAAGTSANKDGQAGYGGGIEYFSQNPPSPAELNITNSTVAHNVAEGGPHAIGSTGKGGNGNGGGIGITTDATSRVTATITDSTISDNHAIGSDGAGIGNGGGFYFAGGNSGALLQIFNSTIAGNNTVAGIGANSNAFSNGGGIYFANGEVNLVNVTVADNSTLLNLNAGTISGNGGGIENASTASYSTIGLSNTLVALNNATANPDYDGKVNYSDNNLIGIADPNSGFNKANSGDRAGTVANPLNPLLGPLQNNGGPTQTMALLSGSPAINAGFTGAQMFTGPYDQRGQGFPRIVGGTIDIGAFEYQPPPSPPSPPPNPAPPTLHTPPLLVFFDALLHGVETINGNNTETVVDSIFGFPLLISTYDGAGDLMSVTLFGINVTFLFELL